jgi:hypothetical protein
MKIRSTLGGLSGLLLSSAALSLHVAGCSGNGSDTTPDAGNTEEMDSSVPSEAGPTGQDSGTGDATATDSGTAKVDSGTEGSDSGVPGDSSMPADSGTTSHDGGEDSGPDASTPVQVLTTTVGAGVVPVAVKINQGTAIGEGSGNGATPSTLTNVAADPSNTQTVTSATDPFAATGTVPDTAAGFCDYSGATPKRKSYVTGAKFETSMTDPMVPMAPFYFPLVFNSSVTTTAHAFGSQAPIVGLFDWRPKDIDEALVVAESDDDGLTWYFMQTVLELNPDYTNPISGGYSASSTNTGCPASITSTNANYVSVNGTTADDGWGHAAIIQLPSGGDAGTGVVQFLYMLDRNTANIQGTTTPIVDNAPLHVIELQNASQKFPIANTNNTNPGANDIKSISTALANTTDGGANAVLVQDSVGLLNPDGIMAVFPTSPTAVAGSPVTVLYVQKIVGGDTTFPTDEQCKKAPFSGKTNHDISNVRLATTTDGVHFTDLGIVEGLNDPTTVDYNRTRWISPRGTLLDIKGDGSVWGMYFAGGNCLDGDSDAFHFIGYAESTDKMHWTVWNDINHPIASINTITTANQSGGAMVTIPANPPLLPTQSWFAERLYAPTAIQIDSTHLSMTFAGYGVQTPDNDLLDYRQIGNAVLTVSLPLQPGVPNNINAH